MATSWPSVARADLAADKAVRTGRVQGLKERDDVLRSHILPMYFAEVTTTSGSYASMWAFTMWVPEAWSGLTANIYIEARRSNTTNATDWRVYDVDGAAALGSAVSVTGTTYAVSGPVSFTIPSAWANTRRQLRIEGKSAAVGTTLYLRCITTYESYVTD